MEWVFASEVGILSTLFLVVSEGVANSSVPYGQSLAKPPRTPATHGSLSSSKPFVRKIVAKERECMNTSVLSNRQVESPEAIRNKQQKTIASNVNVENPQRVKGKNCNNETEDR